MREFNVIIIGVGGQGVLTLANIIAESALKDGWDVKTSELHGLAQRYGSIPCHVRFGEKIYSPLVMSGEANLVVGLEPLEALRACYYGSKENKTIFIIDSHRITPLSVPILKRHYPSMKEIIKTLKQFSKKTFVVNASETVKKITGNTVAANVYLLGYIMGKKLMPIKKTSILKSLEETIPEKYLDFNKKVFDLGFKLKQK